MSESLRTKSLLKGVMKRKVRKFVAFPTGSLGCLNVNQAAKKTCWLTKSLERHK